MKRRDNSEVGSESFVDVVANLIGVLVVLVAIVGVNVTTRAVPDHARALLDNELHALRERASAVRQEIDAIQRSHDRLAAELAKLRAGVEQKRAELRAAVREREVAEKELSEQLKLEADLQRRLQELASSSDLPPQPPAARVLELKAPVSRPVAPGEAELHFELQRNRLSFIPLASLLSGARRQRDQLRPTLEQTGHAEGVAGPIGDFVLRYRVAVDQESLPQRILLGAPVRRARLVEWQIVPTNDHRGEPVDQAIGPGGLLWKVLAGRDPKTTFVTIWVYPDSFGGFRTVRDALYARRYYVAARPLPPGMPIAGSIDGTRSYAQ